MAKIKNLMQGIEKRLRRNPAGERRPSANGILFELNHLLPATVAPDIEGVDVMGKKTKLSLVVRSLI